MKVLLFVVLLQGCSEHISVQTQADSVATCKSEGLDFKFHTRANGSVYDVTCIRPILCGEEPS